MGATNETHLKRINDHGYLYQLAVEQEIERTSSHHRWSIAAHEHRWVDPTTHAEGFIDLVLEHDRMRMVLECKRVLNSHWYFIVPKKPTLTTGTARLAWASHLPHQATYFGWSEFLSEPYTAEAGFCVVPGQTTKDKPMLEHTAGLLVQSVEALAREETQYRPDSERGEIVTLYIPVIVTPAALMVCRFSKHDIDVSLGTLEDNQAEFEQVPLIRFQKTLTTGIGPSSHPDHLRTAHREQQRTVLVVNLQSLPQLLHELDPQCPTEGWPWHVLRQRDGSYS